MPTSTKFQNPEDAIAFEELSSSVRQNTVEAQIFEDENTLDDDVNRLETVIGITADQTVANINYSSNNYIVDGESPIVSLGKLDDALSDEIAATLAKIHYLTKTNAAPPTYVNASTINVKAGKYLCDSGHIMTLGSNTNLDISATGVNGRDGSESSNRHYYPWVIFDSAGVNPPGTLFSDSYTNPTLPSGYDRKCLLPLSVRNDNSSNLMDFVVGSGWPQRPEIWYNVAVDTQTTAASVTCVASGGTSTSFDDISCATFIPPISRMGIFRLGGYYTASSRNMYFRPTGTTIDGVQLTTGTSFGLPVVNTKMAVDASQTIEYRLSGAGSAAYIWVLGYVVTEVT